jgi:hypothetical protein
MKEQCECGKEKYLSTALVQIAPRLRSAQETRLIFHKTFEAVLCL